ARIFKRPCRSTARQRRPQQCRTSRRRCSSITPKTTRASTRWWPAFELALKAAHARYEMHVYLGTQHGFHNNSTPRYNEPAAKLAWERTVAFFKKNLSAPSSARG